MAPNRARGYLRGMASVLAYGALAILSFAIGVVFIVKMPFAAGARGGPLGASGLVLGCVLLFLAVYSWRKGRRDDA